MQLLAMGGASLITRVNCRRQLATCRVKSPLRSPFNPENYKK